MIFCVEDDANIRELEVYTLQSLGYKACGLEDGVALFAALEQDIPELIILDIMLPGEDGLVLLKRLRADIRFAAIPVIMASAKGAEFEKVQGLDSGADDYIAKPFGMMELVSRIKAVLRRCGVKQSKCSVLKCGLLEMSRDEHVVRVAGRQIVLTFKEFELLGMLLQNPGRVLTREQLLTEIWGYDYLGESRTVDVHIRTLRQKLGEGGTCIETIRGVGYRMGVANEK